MNKNANLVIAAGCALLIGTLTASAQDSRFYVTGDVGGTLVQSTQLKEFFGPVAPDTRVKFDPGIRLGVAGGYHVTDWLGVEGQTGFMGNSINGIEGTTYLHDASLSSVPVMAGVRLTLPQPHRFQPFIGGGAGMAFSIFDADQMDLNGTYFHGTDAQPVFAYQAFAGVTYALNDHMDVGLEYHYFATDGTDWRNHAFGTSTDRIKFAGINLNAISLAFQYKF